MYHILLNESRCHCLLSVSLRLQLCISTTRFGTQLSYIANRCFHTFVLYCVINIARGLSVRIGQNRSESVRIGQNRSESVNTMDHIVIRVSYFIKWVEMSLSPIGVTADQSHVTILQTASTVATSFSMDGSWPRRSGWTAFRILPFSCFSCRTYFLN